MSSFMRLHGNYAYHREDYEVLRVESYSLGKDMGNGSEEKVELVKRSDPS